jgi:O-antigen ligase
VFDLMDRVESNSSGMASGRERTTRLFVFSALAFRLGLALVTFEQVRPFGLMLSDYCFFFSLIVLLPSWRLWVQRTRASGIFTAGAFIGLGAVLSLFANSGFTDGLAPMTKLITLYGLFAPLAVIHATNIRKNVLFLIAGISVNCAITIVQAWALPGIVGMLSINPQAPDQSENLRYQGLTEFPVTLGLAAALAVLLATGIVLLERQRLVRWMLISEILICIDGALLSGSRTFFAALIPSLIVLAMLQKFRRRVIMQALSATIFLAGLTYFLPGAASQFSDRINEVGFVDYGRLAVAAQAAIEISQKPVFGWGVNHFADAGLTLIPGINDLQGVHVTFLQYWYGAGLLGAIGFIALFIVPVRRMMLALKAPPNKFTNAARLMLACYVCFFIIFNLGPYLYNRYLYIPMFVFAGFAAHVLESVGARVTIPRKQSRQRTIFGFGQREVRAER